MAGPHRPQQARAVEKHRLILAAATELMLQEGVRAVTHRRVATRAGVSAGSVGYYFSSRDRLLHETVEGILMARRRAARTLVEGIDGPCSPADAATLLLRAFIGREPSDELMGNWLGWVMDNSRGSAEIAALMAEARRELDLILERILDRTGHPGVPVELVSMIINGATVHCLVESREGTVELICQALATLLERRSHPDPRP